MLLRSSCARCWSGACITAALVAGTLVPAAGASPPPPASPLTDEILQGSTMITSRDCDPDGTSSFSFIASGVATGPYEGTFTESGTVTIGPHFNVEGGLPRGPALSFDVQFTISTSAGNITGSKRIEDFSFEPIGECHDFQDNPIFGTGSSTAGSATLSYEARIPDGHGGTFLDRGIVITIVGELLIEQPFPPDQNPAVEQFTSTCTKYKDKNKVEKDDCR
jgi:hypothetical protein